MSASIAEDLTAAQWDKILRINMALHGFTIRENEGDVVIARYPGKFSCFLKCYALSLNSQSAFRMRNANNSQVKLPPPSDATMTTPGGPAILPEFEVVDASSISITEVQSDLQRSLAQNGFSSQTVEASVSGGAFGITAGYVHSPLCANLLTVEKSFERAPRGGLNRSW